MIAQPIIRAIDASGATVSESMFGAADVSRLPYLCQLVADRLTLSGRPFVRLIVDMAVSPEEPNLRPVTVPSARRPIPRKFGQLPDFSAPIPN